MASLIERFEKRVGRAEAGQCWPWKGRILKNGYGVIHQGGRNGGPVVYAHRLAAQFAGLGDISGKMVCHHCDNPPCVNPKHLFVGDAAANVRDMFAKGRGRPPEGERHSHARLTVAQVVSARRRVSAGESRRSIAKEMGVSHTAIVQAVRRVWWKSVA
jgi:hypothetical protein